MSTEKITWDFLKSKGFSDAQTAGIMGNIKLESGFSASAVNHKSGAFGLFQWLGGRKTALQNYAISKGKLASDAELQLQYFWYELQNGEKGTLSAMKEGNYTPEKYAEIFEKKFERSGGAGISKRKEYARQYFNQFANGKDGGSVSSVSTNEYDLKWYGDVVKVVFAILLACGFVIFLGLCLTSNGALKSLKLPNIAKEVNA